MNRYCEAWIRLEDKDREILLTEFVASGETITVFDKGGLKLTKPKEGEEQLKRWMETVGKEKEKVKEKMREKIKEW